jgi:hypothetical protein
MRGLKSATQIMLVLFATTCAPAAFAQSAEQTYTLEKDVLIDTDRCVVVRLELTAAPEADANNTRLEWEYRPGGPGTMAEFGANSANGAYPPQGQPTRVDIVFVAQIAPASKKHPPMLQFTNSQKSRYSEGEGASTSEWHVLGEDLAVSDVFHIDIQSGTHPLQDDLVIGEFAGQPITLFFGTDRAYRGGKTAKSIAPNESTESESGQDEPLQEGAG